MEALKKKRGGHRARGTNLTNKVNEELCKAAPSLDILEMYSLELSRQIDIVAPLDTSILDLCTTDAEIQDEVDGSSDWSMKISLAISKSKKLIASQNTDRRATVGGASETTVKLPQLRLVKFSGQPLEWTNFWEVFRTSVHENASIKPAMKFQYLIGQLEDKAAQLLAGFTNTDQEYEEAIDLLVKTYGQKHILLQSRLNAILDIESPQPTSESLDQFRSTYEGHLRVLKSLGTDVEGAGFVFAHILLRKLPASTRDNISRANGTEVWTISRFRDAINAEVHHLMELQDSKGFVQSQPEVRNHEQTAAFPVTTKAKGNGGCRFCLGDHFSINCSEYTTVDKRRQQAKKLNLCYNCLLSNHAVSECKNAGRCRKCSKKHHSTLCFEGSKYDKKPVNDSKKSENENSKNTSAMTIASASSLNNNVTSLLPTANLKILSDNKISTHRALLDNCSQSTFILKKLANYLNLEICDEINLEIDGFESVGKLKNYDVVKLNVKTNTGVVNIRAVVVNNLPTRVTMNGRSELIKKLKNSQNLDLADDSLGDVINNLELIVGMDNYYKFIDGNKLSDDLYQVSSNLGSIITGTIPHATNSSTNSTILNINVQSGGLDEQLRNMWELETIGIKDTNSDEQSALEKFKSNLSFSEGKYQASLPWKDEDLNIPTNKTMAFQRMKSIWAQLQKDPQKLEIYDGIIKTQLESGFIEIAPENSNSDKLHYLPHHYVTKESSSTTPIRMVFDCSSKSKDSKSLNDCLFTGPSLVNDLGAVLLRSRLGSFLVSADIEKAFLMVGLKEEDRDSVRFFWPRDVHDVNSPIVTYRFKVVLFGSTASQFLLNSTILHHLSLYSNSTSEKLERNIYVDNVICTFNSKNEMLDFYKNSKTMLDEGGFNLRQWCSNSKEFLEEIPSSDKCDEEVVKILGVDWHTDSDIFSIEPFVPPETEKLTKRTIATCVSKTYDIFGYLLPITVTGKYLIQQIWKTGSGWDEEVSEDIRAKWLEYISDIRETSVQIDRKFYKFKNPTLHVFCDASKRCFGAVAYFVENENVNFVLAKSRLAPTKSPSLPQLELTALNLGAKLAKYICESFAKELEIKRIVLWSDSQVALQWVFNGQSNKKPYVRQRVQNINDLCPDAECKFISGELNVADLLTRGLSAKEFKNSNWLSGPKNFTELDCEISKNEIHENSSTHENKEIALPVVQTDQKTDLVPIVDAKKFGSFGKMLRVTSYVLKFLSKFKLCRERKLFKIEKCTCDNFRICSTELNISESVLVGLYQKFNYTEVFEYLKTKRGTKPPVIDQLNLYLDENVLKSRGRISNSFANESSKFPILLHPECEFTKLVVRWAHLTTLHTGVNALLSFIREKWWIPRGRQVVKSVLRKCVACNKVQGKPFSAPPYPPLPIERCAKFKPFEVTGVDYTGAILVKSGSTVTKAYVILFTCSITRAVHLELVYSLSEEVFLDALVKFSARRSFPKLLISDNAKTFEGSAKTLKEIYKSKLLTSFLGDNRIEWKFSTPRSPWQGGFWERLIGLMKDCLKKVIGGALLTGPQLETLIVQIESRLNDRPITFNSDNLDDLAPITPSLLIFGHKLRDFPDTIDEDQISDLTYNSAKMLSKAFIYRTKVLENFWKRWESEYLKSLRERFNIPNRNRNNLLVPGQIVLIHDNVHRSQWKMGMILELIPSLDQYVRSVKLKVSNGTLIRPVTKIYPLEVQSNEPPVVERSPAGDRSVRPVRVSAQKAQDKIRAML